MRKKTGAASSLLDQILDELYVAGPKGHILEADECTTVVYCKRHPEMSRQRARERLEAAVERGLMTSFIAVVNGRKTRVYKLTEKAGHGRSTHPRS